QTERSEEISGQVYNPDIADATASPRRVLFERRFWQGLFIGLRFMLRATSDPLFPPRELSEKRLRQLKAARIRELLIELGPTFIKVGQFLSARRDVLPLEIAAELALLQDRVPPESSDTVRSTIEASLGPRAAQCFASFENVPVASASIGQVHR